MQNKNENENKKKILYIDLDGVLVDFQSGIENLDARTKRRYEGRYKEVPGIFSFMTPMKDALESFEKLSEKFDTYLLSTSPWDNPTGAMDKVNWVKRYLGKPGYKRLILSHHKHLNCGDYLIDDRKANGSEKFQGEFIEFKSEEFPDWKAVLKYFSI